MGTIKSYKFSENFNYREITRHAIKTFKAKELKDAIIIEKDGGHAFIFKQGIAILWDIKDEAFLLKQLSLYALSSKSPEVFGFEYSGEQQIRIERDTFQMDKLDDLTMLSVSFAIAQSLKLGEFEEAMVESLQETEHIPKELARYGRVSMKRKEIAKERGRLFLAKSRIYLHFELLDIPEFIWEYPELESYYLAARKYLEIQPRIEILNRKLNIVQEILGILANEKKEKEKEKKECIM